MNAMETTDVEAATKEVEAVARELIEELDRLMPAALRGREPDARAYVDSWRRLTRIGFSLARESVPDLVFEDEQGEIAFLDVKGMVSPAGSAHFDYLALNAPFSAWVSHLGAGRGAALFLLSELREAIPGLHPLQLPDDFSGLPDWNVDLTEFRRFVSLVCLELQGGQTILGRIANTFALTNTDMGRLFGVRRQAIEQWLQQGIPPARQPKALMLAQIADVLNLNLQSDRIPAIARTPAPAFGGLSMLDFVTADRHEELLATVKESFDWSSAA